MTAARRRWAAEILYVWFHELRPEQRFGRSDEVDAMLRRRFAGDLQALSGRPAASFLTDPLAARAAILLFDQIPRNLFRDDPRAFAHDRLARAITHGALARRWDRAMSREARQFLYMPLMHSEDIADQRLCLRHFTAMGDSFVTGFARDHYRMIARFGRFPHRNRTLGRKSTIAEERAVAAGNAW